MLAIFHKKFVFSGNSFGRFSAVTSLPVVTFMEMALRLNAPKRASSDAKAMEDRILFSAATFPREGLAAFCVSPPSLFRSLLAPPVSGTFPRADLPPLLTNSVLQ